MTALQAAVRLNLSAALAAALPAAAAALCGAQAPDVVQDGDVGELLLRALLGRAAGILPVELCAVLVATSDGVVSLDLEDARTSQLLTGWPCDTLAEALGWPVLQGARAAFLAPLAITCVELQVSHGETGELTGMANLRLPSNEGTLTASAHFGPVGAALSLRHSHTFAGAALYEVGRQARIASQAPGSTPLPSPEGDVQPTPVVIAEGSGTIN